MLLRALIIACGLIVIQPATAKDMSDWSDKTLCRVQDSLKTDAGYNAEVRIRGLICPSVGSKDAPFRKPYFQSTSALCTNLLATPTPPADEAPIFNLIDHIPAPSTILSHSPPGKLMLVHDFNYDGRDDLLVNTGLKSTHLHLLLGQETGGFLDVPLANAKGATGQVSRIQITDLNQDRWPDFLVYTLGGQNQLFINQLGKGFKATLLAADKEQTFSIGGDIADLNQDGKPDLLAISNQAGSAKHPLLGGDDKYNFELSNNPYAPVIDAHRGQDLASGDLNKDGFLDVVISMSASPIADTLAYPLEGSLYIIYGDGDVNFENNQHAYLGAASDLGGPVKLLDLNGDGQLDIVQAYSRQVNDDTYLTSLRAYMNTSSDQTCFTDISAQLLPDVWHQLWIHGPVKTGNHAVRDIQLSDANQDDKLDMWVQFQTEIQAQGLLLQVDDQFRTASLLWPSESPKPLTDQDDILAGDFNGDGFNDIAKITNQDNHIEIQLWLHTSRQLAPLAPYQPTSFTDINESQVEILQGFIDDKFSHPVPWQQLIDGTNPKSESLTLETLKGDYLLAWYWLPAKAAEVDFLGLDNVKLTKQGLQLTTKSVYQFNPTRSYREQLQFNSNRQQQFILRGKLNIRAGKPAQEIELFGNLANLAALGVLEDGSMVLIELIKP